MKAYIKILAASGKYGDHILGKKVEYTEKIDGSQFGFGKDANGKLYMRSKGTMINYLTDPCIQKLFHPAVEHVLSIQDKIPNNTAFYCETLCKPCHNTLQYERVPKNHLMLYGVTDFERTASLASSYDKLKEYADIVDIEAVPLIAEGVVLNSVADMADPKLMDRESALGGVKIEGIVAKQYDSPFEFSGMVMPFTALKYVSEQFKEKHASNPDWKPQGDKLQDLFSMYKTEARWHKAVQHLRDSGLLVEEPKDIGPLMGELAKDLILEEKENFKEELYKLYYKQWIAKIQSGFPDWYKKELMKSEEIKKE